MLIVRIWGGLGNQLFQYCSAYSIAQKLGKKLYIDKSFYSNSDVYREFKLDKFGFDIREINQEELSLKIKFFKNKYVNKLIRYIRLNKLCSSYDLEYIKEVNHEFIKDFKNSQILYLDGYFQTNKYFEEFRTYLLDSIYKFEFSNECSEILNLIKLSENSVSIHFRRTDFLKYKNRGYYIPDMNYYENAIYKFYEINKNTQYYIFSDDIKWVRENLKCKGNFNFIELKTVNSDIEELICMSRCSNNIIASSTFSWWAAWLNENKYKKVIVPHRGFKNTLTICKDWIILNS